MSRLPVRIVILSLSVVVFFSAGHICAQGVGQYVAKGNKELHDGYPNSAIFYYKKALKADTFLLEAHYQMGEAYRVLRNYKNAQKHYEAAIGNDGEDKLPEAIYYLGLMQKSRAQYIPAKRSFNSFLSVYRKKRRILQSCSR